MVKSLLGAIFALLLAKIGFRIPYRPAPGIGSFSSEIAGIAQLVEHDLAKVGVASSSLVSRSVAQVVKSVDTQDLKSCDR